MAPVTSVKFLALKDEGWGIRDGVGFGAEVSDIRDALLLVDDEIFNDRKILGRGLGDQVHRRISVSTAVVHVNVNISADPMPVRILGQRYRLEANGHFGVF